MLNCRRFAREPSWIELFAKVDLALSSDWHGATLDYPFCFHLALGPTRLYFGASADVKTVSKPKTAAGEFVEGLWEYDVVECFLTSTHSEAYQEFNLSPNGSWWTAMFTDYRKRAPATQKPTSCDIFAQVGGTSFMTGLSIALDDIALPWGKPEEMRLQLASILSSPTRTFLSSSPTPAGAPDFHLRDGFQPLNLIEDGKK